MSRMFIDRCDPDWLQARMERAGRKIEALRARGICAHGYIQERLPHNGALGNPKHAAAFAALEVGQVICNDCGEVFADSGAHQDARTSILSA